MEAKKNINRPLVWLQVIYYIYNITYRQDSFLYRQMIRFWRFGFTAVDICGCYWQLYSSPVSRIIIIFKKCQVNDSRFPKGRDDPLESWWPARGKIKKRPHVTNWGKQNNNLIDRITADSFWNRVSVWLDVFFWMRLWSFLFNIKVENLRKTLFSILLSITRLFFLFIQCFYDLLYILPRLFVW